MERFDPIFAEKSGFIRTDNLSKDVYQGTQRQFSGKYLFGRRFEI